MITCVYGPQGELEKKMFIKELGHLRDSALPSWLIIGDFNIIYKDEDKNNGRLNRRLMLRFRMVLNHLEMKEIQLIGRKYTWTNSQQPSTMTRIDMAFSTTEWEDLFTNPVVQPLSSSVSDHCSLLLTSLNPPKAAPRFRFESFLVDKEGSQECL
jgi:exonuclease III